MFFDEATERIQIAHLVHGRAESRESGHKLGKVTARARQAPERHAGPGITEVAFDELEKSLTPFARRRWTGTPVALDQGAGLSENPGIAKTAAANRNSIGTRRAQEAQSVPGIPHTAAAQHPC